MSAEAKIFRSELRGEKHLYGLAALTTVFAAVALTLVLAVGDTFERSFAASAQTLLGGDVSVRLRQRDFSAAETAWLQQNSRALSAVQVAAALAVVGDNNQMVRIKFADSAYPLYGKLTLQNNDAVALQNLLAADAEAGGAYPVAVAEELLILLDLQIGDRFTAAGLTLRISDVVLQEPDPDQRLWMAVPLVLAGVKAATHSSAGGNLLASRFIRVLLPAGVTDEAWMARLTAAFPDSEWRVRAAPQAMPSLRNFIKRMRNFLSLMSLAAMFTAGIGIGGATSAFLRARLRAISIVKMLGGNRRLIARVYLQIAALFVLGGGVAGTAIGAVLLFQVAPFLSASLPLSLTPQWPWAAMGKALFVTAAFAAAFVIPPVLRAGRSNPLTLFKAAGNEQDAPPYTRYDFIVNALVWAAVLLLIPLGWRVKIAAVGILSAAALIYGLSVLCAQLAGSVARRTVPPISWGLLAVSRNCRQTAGSVVALSIGMALLIAILNIQSNFVGRINDTLRRQAPAIYLLGIQEKQLPPLRQTLTEESPQARLRTIPFMRGRIKSLAGKKTETIKASPEYQWILSGDRGLTWTDGGYIGASKVVAGTLWAKNESRPQASFEAAAAKEFGLKLGDSMELSILGRRLTTVITSFREADWQSFDVNFVVLLDRRPFGTAPYSMMGAAFLPPADEAKVKLAIARTFPNITPISLGTVFDLTQRLLRNVALLLQAAAVFILAGTIPVVVSSLMDSQRRRVQDAVTLRLLGAPRNALIIKGLAEFTAITAAALLPALIFGLLAAKLVVEILFELKWEINGGHPLLIAAAGASLFLLVGCFSIARWIRQPPLAVIRND